MKPTGRRSAAPVLRTSTLARVAAHSLRIGVGLAAHDADVILDLGPVHPAGMGGWQLDVEVDGDVIVAAEPRIGFAHRADEKLLEARDYRQGLALVGRHDWFASTSSEIAYALAVEQALGLVPSAHTTWSRTLLAEVVRVQALLLLAGGALVAEARPGTARRHDDTTLSEPPVDSGLTEVGWLALAHRERLLDAIEQVSGERVHPMLVRIGGMATTFGNDWLDALANTMAALRADLPAISDVVRAYAVPFAGVGVLDRQTAVDLGASGPVGRAGGVDLDLRTRAPYLAYADLASLAMPFRCADGDVPARYDALLHDLGVAVDLVDACVCGVRAHAGEPVEVALPKTVRLPEGTTVGSVEGPVGLTSVTLVSRGDRSPWRASLRTPSFAHVQAMARATIGTRLTDLTAVAMSFMVAIGDADR